MSISQHIPEIDPSIYPTGGNTNFAEIYEEIVRNNFSAFIRRLSIFGFSFPALDTDSYYTRFGEFSQSTFTVDPYGYPAIHPGTGRLWLIYVHTEGRVSVFVAHHVQFGRGHVYLFGDRARGLRVNLDEGKVSVSGVALREADVVSSLQDGVEVL